MSEADEGRTIRDGRAGDSGSTEVVADRAPDTVREPGVGLPGIGETVADKYVVERVIGAGGMGQVLAVRHQRLDQLFAMKVLDPELVDDEDARARFGREARAMAQLTSPYTVRVHDVAELPNKLPYLVMDYLEGEDLGRVLRAKGALSIDDAVRYIDQACEALEEAHAAGLVHRDLKPQNLFLAKDAKGNRSVRVLDFGIARAFGGKMGKLVTITRHGDLLGTLAYMAPEQIRSARTCDPRTDIFAIGSCLYRVLTNSRPFVGAGEASLVEAILTKEPHPLRDLRPDVPAALDFVVQRCMKKEPAARFASVTELRSALRIALVVKDVPLTADDATVPMTNAPARPPPVKSARPPSTQPMAAVKLEVTPGPVAPAAAPPVAPPPPQSGPALYPSAPPPRQQSLRPPAKSSDVTLYAIVVFVMATGVAIIAAVLHALLG
jgi:serine/threonine-protein kinase